MSEKVDLYFGTRGESPSLSLRLSSLALSRYFPRDRSSAREAAEQRERTPLDVAAISIAT